jgi:hypothetical protein
MMCCQIASLGFDQSLPLLVLVRSVKSVDIEKAFETVWHIALRYKMYTLRIIQYIYWRAARAFSLHYHGLVTIKFPQVFPRVFLMEPPTFYVIYTSDIPELNLRSRFILGYLSCKSYANSTTKWLRDGCFVRREKGYNKGKGWKEL